MRHRWWRRRWVLIPAVLVLLLILIVVLGPVIARPIVRGKLRAMVRDQLNADLEIGPLTYHFPYGVSVDDARLIALGPDGAPVDIAAARHISIALAKMPIGTGPLVISSLSIDSPSIHLIKTAGGIVGQGLTAKPDQPADVRRQKISEMLQLRRVAVTDGQLIFDDRTAAGAVPLAWRGLKLDLKTGAQSGSKYNFDLNVGDGKIASLLADGWFDVDDLFAHVECCALKVNVDPAAPDSPIPAELQLAMKKYDLSGAVAINLAGDVPLMAPSRGKMTTTIELPRATGRLPDADAPLDELALKLTFSGEPLSATSGDATVALKALPLLKLHFDRVAARTRDTFVQVEGGDVILNAASGAWGVSDLKLIISPGADRSGLPRAIREALDRDKISGQITITINGSGPIGARLGSLQQVVADVVISPKDLTLQPPDFPLPLTGFADVKLHLADNAIAIEGARAEYGKDIFFIQRASVPLSQWPGRLVVEKIAGCVTFRELEKRYPEPLSSLLQFADPRGAFFFDGTVSLDPNASDLLKDYGLHVSTTGAIASVRQPRRAVISGMMLDATATPRSVEVKKFNATVFTGDVSATARVDLSDPAIRYAADVHARHVDLNGLAQLMVKPGEKPIVSSGDVGADIALRGRLDKPETALDDLTAEGSVSVDAGELLRVEILDSLISKIGIRNAGAVGEAAATFKLEKRIVHLSEVVLNAPAAGVRGSGDLGLDGALDLKVSARALGDWEKKIRRDDSGSVANVVGSMAGSVQRGLDSMAESVLYRVHVGGTIDKPDIQVVTAPGLRDK